MDDEKQLRRFRWGLLLAWSFPLVVLLTSVALILISASFRPGTTSLKAVAGHFSTEAFENFGIVTATSFQITAIILLVRSWPGGQSPFRAMMSLISIGCAALILFICGAAVWSRVHGILH